MIGELNEFFIYILLNIHIIEFTFHISLIDFIRTTKLTLIKQD